MSGSIVPGTPVHNLFPPRAILPQRVDLLTKHTFFLRRLSPQLRSRHQLCKKTLPSEVGIRIARTPRSGFHKFIVRAYAWTSLHSSFKNCLAKSRHAVHSLFYLFSLSPEVWSLSRVVCILFFLLKNLSSLLGNEIFVHVPAGGHVSSCFACPGPNDVPGEVLQIMRTSDFWYYQNFRPESGLGTRISLLGCISPFICTFIWISRSIYIYMCVHIYIYPLFHSDASLQEAFFALDVHGKHQLTALLLLALHALALSKGWTSETQDHLSTPKVCRCFFERGHREPFSPE